ncbi:MAG: efflux RND transporter periplasmic adaptor subunit [Bacteroidales bacterium]|jgi:membrane fusion protein (multidrug efflux system)|nr:efflux RND transporter periplasmic adaptor subunit [Bacteroidales bacterium]
MKKKSWIILLIVFALFISGMIFIPRLLKQTNDEDADPVASAPAKNRSLNVNAQIITIESLYENIRTTGSLMPDEEVDLSFETSGKITNIYFKEGSEVKQGELLAKVNDKPLQAELKKLEAQIPLAQDRVFRQQTLLEKDAVSQEAYEQVKTDLEKLNADIELVKSHLAQTELRAPFDGVIGLRLVSEGSYASPTTIIARLTKIKPLKLEFSINERYANDIKSGTLLSFTVEGDLDDYTASVYAVEPQVDLQTRTMKARALYPNTNGKMQPGRSAFIEIRMQEIKDAVTVPSEAVIAEMGRSIAYLYKNGKAWQVELERGLRTESHLQVLRGIKPCDTLLVTGVMQLRDGMDVVIDRFIEY